MTATLGATPRQNYESFVEHGRLSSAFGEIVFDDHIWRVASNTNHPNGPPEGKLSFTVKSTTDDPAAPAMAKKFADFIKSVVRLDQARKQSHIATHNDTIAVARLLHAVSADIAHDPCLFSTSTFRRAEQLAKTGRMMSRSPYNVGRILQKLGKILTDAGITPHRIDYRNTTPRPSERRPGAGEEDPRMPDEAALAALARASQLVSAPPDVLRMRIVELLSCAAWRINDILRLPVDCEVFEPATRNGRPLLDAEGRQILRYGIRYLGSKGFVGDVKWIPTAMVDVARRAIGQIRELTAEARRTAEWMERHPGRAWLADPFKLASPDRILTGEELVRALQLNAATGVGAYARTNHIPLSSCSTAHIWRYRVGDVERALLGRHKAIQGKAALKRSEYLLLIQRNFLNAQRGICPSVIDIVQDHHVRDFLKSRGNCLSIFERFDLRDSDGRPYALLTHQIRHFLNTIAAEGGLGEVERATWSGRSDIRSNDVYDHESASQLADKARALLETGRMHGHVADTYRRMAPVDRKAFSLVQLATVHTTDIGMCTHDWGTAPCPHHGACADCRDCAVVKGDPVHRARIELLLAEEETTLARALVEIGKETYGASNYVEHHRRMVGGYRRMLAIHDDPDIEDGDVVQMEPEPERRGLLEDAQLV
ncbi:hypothetical protein [Methylobacterium haplocladii]|uniref:Integrase n=1 Tax=Methylobacterium haplocladii TaxID=1176176 RepID=A0A512IN26_9HYPH|nr:hypothetical protein [Methylobacterium haplocladii]GEO99114.1 hypothetical protein MHA02_15020 [Methylobacterium haplocladii]